MTLTRWNPVRDLIRVQNEMDRLVDRFFTPDLFEETFTEFGGWLPNTDIAEDKDKFTVQMELPGLTKEDVHITFQNGTLRVEGERKQEEEKEGVNYHRTERRYGKFVRTFNLGSGIQQDKIDATFKDGILTIHLPKVEEVKPKEIPVKVSK